MRIFQLPTFFACLAVFAILTACAGGVSPDAAATSLQPFTAEIEKLLVDTRTFLVPISQSPAAHADDAVSCTVAMVSQYRNNPKYTALGVARADGTLFCLTTPQTTPANIADRAYFQRAVRTKSFSVGDYQIGRATGKQSVGLAVPLLDSSNNPQGVVLSPVDLDWLTQDLAALPMPAGAEFVLLDSNGNVLVHLPVIEGLLGKSISDTPLGKAMLSQIDGGGEFAGMDNTTRVFKFTSPSSSNKNWIVALGLKK